MLYRLYHLTESVTLWVPMKTAPPPPSLSPLSKIPSTNIPTVDSRLTDFFPSVPHTYTLNPPSPCLFFSPLLSLLLCIFPSFIRLSLLSISSTPLYLPYVMSLLLYAGIKACVQLNFSQVVFAWFSAALITSLARAR